MRADRWKSDWRVFVQMIATEFDKGKEEGELSRDFGDNQVRWKGKISDIQLHAEYAAGVRLDMPSVEATVRSNLTLIADEASVGVSESTVATWDSARVGDQVEFECTLTSGNDMFPGIKLSVFLEERQCFLELALRDGILRSIL